MKPRTTRNVADGRARGERKEYGLPANDAKQPGLLGAVRRGPAASGVHKHANDECDKLRGGGGAAVSGKVGARARWNSEPVP